MTINIFSKKFEMMTFVKDNFRKTIKFFLYLIVIIFTVIGFNGGLAIGMMSNKPLLRIIFVVLFSFIGYLIGLIVAIINGGLLSTFFNIDQNIQKLKEYKSSELNKE